MKILAEQAGRIEVLEPQAFKNEAQLQRILADYPDLVLAGASDDAPRSIFTIGVEVKVPSGSIDLLLMDSTGRIWVVEAKLGKNPEIRKQVVGQVLAYAADVADWDRETLEWVAADYLAQQGASPSSLLELASSRVGEQEADRLIDTAVERLGKGDVTALVVVDELNSVLRHLVEFVNSNAKFELLALKLEVVPHAGSRLFIPTVVGTTAQPSDNTYADLLAAAPQVVRDVEQKLDEVAEGRGWGTFVSGTAKSYRLAQGGYLFRLQPGWAQLQLDMIGGMRDGGFEAEADQLHALICDMAGRSLGPRGPSLKADAIAAHWVRFRDELLPLYADTVRRYREAKAAAPQGD